MRRQSIKNHRSCHGPCRSSEVQSYSAVFPSQHTSVRYSDVNLFVCVLLSALSRDESRSNGYTRRKT